MAERVGYLTPVTADGDRLQDTVYLDRLTTYRAADVRLVLTPQVTVGAIRDTGLWDASVPKNGFISPNYYAEFYNRVYAIPKLVNLGAISTEQVFTVQVWNADDTAAHLQSITVQNGEGVEIIGESSTTFASLALKKWTVRVSMRGPTTIDTVIRWNFPGAAVTVHITGSRSSDWAYYPDWSEPVTENLEFLTAVHQSQTGAEQRIARRLSPRRTFEFKVMLSGQQLQQFETAMYAMGGKVWLMPVFTDALAPSYIMRQGDAEIRFNTAGYDFKAGGQALIVQGSRKESVEIARIVADRLFLARPLQFTYNALARIYPLRAAVLTDMPQISRLSDNAATAQVRLKIHEHSGYSADISHLPTYRGKPVLEPTSEWSEDVTAQYLRLIKQLDNDTGLPYYLDTAMRAFALVSHRFVLSGRTAQDRLRRLFYYLRGRQKPVWVATSGSDVTPQGNLSGRTLDIEAVGYTDHLLQQPGRQDVRIELTNGQVHYRHVVSANTTAVGERLVFDGDVLYVAKHEIAKVSYLSLSRLESDQISWAHQTDADGVAVVTVLFRAVREELET